MTNQNNKLLSYSMVSSALLDPQFYTSLPEFSPLREKLKNLKVNIAPGKCTGCQKKRIEANLYKDFISILGKLSPEKCETIKNYYRISNLMLNVVDPATRKVEFKTI